MKIGSNLILSAFPVLFSACFLLIAGQSASAQSDNAEKQRTHSVLDRSPVSSSKTSQTKNSVSQNVPQKATPISAQKKATNTQTTNTQATKSQVAKAQAIDSRRVILSPQQRQIKRATPITQRPNRPLHFYGNTVRRRAASGRAIFNRGTRR